jgi:hypothetical protein
VPAYWAGNVIFEGVTETETEAIKVPVPLKTIVSGLSAALSVIATMALRVPNAVGVKVS